LIQLTRGISMFSSWPSILGIVH